MQSRWGVIAFFTLVLALSACAGVNGNQNPTPPPPSFSETPTEQSQSSITPFPTLSLFFNELEFMDLISQNSTCSFPCLMTVSPGKTTGEETRQLLNQFSAITTRFYDEENEGRFMQMYFEGLGLLVSIAYQTSTDYISVFLISFSRLDQIRTDDGVLLPYSEGGGFTEVEDPNYFVWLQDYTLENIIEMYGQPVQVYIKSFNVNPANFDTHVILYYPEDGFMVEYTSETDYYFVSDDQAVSTTCPSTGAITIRVFDPNGELDLVSLLADLDNFELYKELEVATNMTIEEFVNTYGDGGCSVAVETPADLWPEVYDLSPED